MRGLRHQLLWGLLVASLLLAVMQLWAVYRVKRENALIADWVVLTEQNVAQHSSDATAAEPVYGRSPEVRMARASYLRQKQRYNEALEILSLIVGHGDSRLRTQSRYNLGNLYLSQAMAEIEAGQLNQAAPLLMLAKQAYRLALAEDSGFWDAKYNLELAMKLLPEFDRISPNAPDEDATAPSQLWTTLPGFPRGLP